MLASFVAAATDRIHAASLAGVQAAAGIVGRALSAATIENDGGAVDPHLLEGIGTDLIRAGRFLGRLTVGPARTGADSSRCVPWRVSSTVPIQIRIRGSTGYKKAGHPMRARCAPRQAEVVNVRINSDSLSTVGRHRAPGPCGCQSGQLAARLASESWVTKRTYRCESDYSDLTRVRRERRPTNSRKRFLVQLPGRLAFPETQRRRAAARAGRVRHLSDFRSERAPGGRLLSAGRHFTRTCFQRGCGNVAAYLARS